MIGAQLQWSHQEIMTCINASCVSCSHDFALINDLLIRICHAYWSDLWNIFLRFFVVCHFSLFSATHKSVIRKVSDSVWFFWCCYSLVAFFSPSHSHTIQNNCFLRIDIIHSHLNWYGSSWCVFCFVGRDKQQPWTRCRHYKLNNLIKLWPDRLVAHREKSKLRILLELEWSAAMHFAMQRSCISLSFRPHDRANAAIECVMHEGN